MNRTPLYCFFAFITLMFSCQGKQQQSTEAENDTIVPVENDSTVYGYCGAGTTMHTLQLITDYGDSLDIMISNEDFGAAEVTGGMIAGDRMAVIMRNVDGEYIASGVLNLNTLEGKWTSIDKNFEIQNGGTVVSSQTSESNPYTNWKILNGKLLLNRDTFNVLTLGADTLELENSTGIFVYKRLIK